LNPTGTHRPGQADADQAYTVLLVPERGAKVTKVVLTGWHVMLIQQLARVQLTTVRVWIAGAGALALVAGMVGMTWQYISLSGRVHENTTLREENLELQAKLSTIQEKIAHINEVLSRTKHLYANLQNISQLSDPDRKLAIAAEDRGEEDPRDGVDPRKLDDQLEQLGAEATSQEESLRPSGRCGGG
jgi:hypothetical protein